MDYIVVPAIAYLIGSIPFGYILVRLFKKQDIRTTGSGNIGATNVARTAPGLGVATLILDALKGLVPVYLLSAYAYHHAHVAHRSLLVGLAALFVVLALAGCAQGTSGQAGAQYPPYPPDNNGNTPEHGVGGGSGM